MVYCIIQDRKLVGPFKLKQLMYMFLGVASLGMYHMAVKMYNCDRQGFEYFCPEGDDQCLQKLALQYPEPSSAMSTVQASAMI